MSRSGISYINSRPELVRQWIERDKQREEEYRIEHPDSMITLFEGELRSLGFVFEVTNQTFSFMPKHKDIILPLAIKYYKQARELLKDNEQNHFLGFFRYKGFEEVVPMLLEDFYSESTLRLTREFIGETLRVIGSKKYIDEYLEILSNQGFGVGRFSVVDLVSKLKVEQAIPLFIDMLEDEKCRTHAICALGNYKREEFRPYFERFENDKNTVWRRYARAALKKLG